MMSEVLRHPNSVFRHPGHVLLYDKNGALVFSGGVTPARGHEGDSIGNSMILAIIRKEKLFDQQITDERDELAKGFFQKFGKKIRQIYPGTQMEKKIESETVNDFWVPSTTEVYGCEIQNIGQCSEEQGIECEN